MILTPVMASPLPSPPGPRLLPWIGLPLAFARDLLGFVESAAREHGGIVSIGGFGPTPALLVTDPELVGQVLQGRWREFVRDDLVRSAGGPVFGRGLLFAEGDLWLRLRQAMQPAFRRDRLRGLVELIDAEVERHVDRLLAKGGRVEMADEMARLTQEVFVRAMFSASLGDDLDRLLVAWTTVNEYVAGRLINPIHVPPTWPTPGNRKLRAAMAIIDGIVRPLVAARRLAFDEGHETHDLLGMLLAARDPETGEGLSDELLHEQILMTFFAGFETTSSALTRLWLLLAEHPDAEQRLHAELDAVLGDRRPSADDLPQLTWLRMIIDETLRLYPSAFMLVRQAVGDQELGGYPIRAGTLVFMSTWVMHRDPKQWPEPERFDPERFGPGSPERGKFVYIPFGAGPRLCIGKQLALMEAQLIVAGVARRLRARPVPGATYKSEPLFTLHVAGGAPMLIERR